MNKIEKLRASITIGSVINVQMMALQNGKFVETHNRPACIIRYVTDSLFTYDCHNSERRSSDLHYQSFPSIDEEINVEGNCIEIFQPYGKVIIKLLSPAIECWEDDRIFTSADLWELSYETVQQFMAAAFCGCKTVDGKSPEEYISQRINEMTGS